MTVSPALAENGTSTVTVTARDQYNNPLSGVQFKYDLTVTDASGSTDESYTVDGTNLTDSTHPFATNNIQQLTDSNGQVQFDISLPAAVDTGDGMSLQVQKAISNGSINIGNSISFTKE